MTAVSTRTRRSMTSPSIVLRLEGASLALAATWVFYTTGTSWWWFLALALAPDVGLLGYLAGSRIGAVTYNVTHTLVVPLALAAFATIVGAAMALAVAAVWIAHIGIDRVVGYGLKYPDGPRTTHLQRVAGA